MVSLGFPAICILAYICKLILYYFKVANNKKKRPIMGMVTDVEPDIKGLVRSVKPRTRNTELRRPVHKLVLILAADERKDHDENSKDFKP